MAQVSINRRSFIRLCSAGVAASPLLAVFSACKKEGPDCSDLSAVKPDQLATRNALKYVASSTVTGKQCANCAQYQAPTAANSCGGCKLFPGPVTPQGYCLGWVRKAA